MVLLISAIEHKRSLASSQMLSFFLILTSIFDVARLRTLVLVGMAQDSPLLVAGLALTLAARVSLLALENTNKKFCLREDLKQLVCIRPTTR